MSPARPCRRSLLTLSVALTLALVLGGCAPDDAPPDLVDSASPPARVPLQLGDLLILDGDAGATLPGGERAGVLFVARAQADGGYAAPVVLADDPRWHEPTDFVLLSDGTILVVESSWAAGVGEGRGALFLVELDGQGGASVTLWWSDERLRRPVSVVRDAAGTVYVSDRDANPLGLDGPTGCVLAIPTLAGGSETIDGLGRPGRATVLAAGPELVTPGPLLVDGDGSLLLMDADANPRGVLFDDGRPGTPGVLYRVTAQGLQVELEPTRTVSPIGLLLSDAGELYVIDANHGQARGVMGDGAVFLRTEQGLRLVVDSLQLGRARALVDPCGGDTLADGRLVVADANADPLGRGEDGTGKGVYGTGPGALLVVDPVRATVETLLADERFVMPLAVRRVRR